MDKHFLLPFAKEARDYTYEPSQPSEGFWCQVSEAKTCHAAKTPRI